MNCVLNYFTNLQDLWVQRKISNFEYLMILNTFANRTFNDLTQYPVYPWIISDFESPIIDLEDENFYRDLSKPIVLNFFLIFF